MPSPAAKTPSLFGGLLLTIGNVVGAGILGLPIATSQLGLPCAILVLFAFWCLMTLGAYYLLEANFALPQGSNFISMTRSALGKWGVALAWISYLLVMYSLIAAYIAGGSDLIKVNSHYLGITLPSWAAPLLFLGVFGFIVSRGIHLTDHTNRLLMIAKAILFFATMAGLALHVNSSVMWTGSLKNLSVPLLIIVVTSFGFAPLIPSLRTYYQSDLKKIKRIIFWGTLIPLMCYIVWIGLIFSIVPYEGAHGLKEMSSSPHPLADLQFALTHSLGIAWITQATNAFSAFCILTSFLANSISLTDFMADGLSLYKNNKKTWAAYFTAYIPPLCAVLFYPRAFVLGLSVAGIFAIVQLLVLPGLIVWFLRYKQSKNLSYSVMGGKTLLALLLIVSFMILFLTVIQA
jgi:tyrosine-specific transport protein